MLLGLIIMTPMVFHSLYEWKMMKDTPNHVPDNIIGQAQTSRKIHEDSLSLYSWQRSFVNPACTGSKPITVVELITTSFLLRGGCYNIYMSRYSVCDTTIINQAPEGAMSPKVMVFVKQLYAIKVP